MVDFELRPVGRVESSLADRRDAPMQGFEGAPDAWLAFEPDMRDALDGIGKSAAPLALLVLGMGLAEYDVREGLDRSLALCVLKLIVQPLIVWGLAELLGLPPVETSAVVLLASMSIGVNVYLMAVQFGTLQSTIASSLVLSTGLASITTPVLLALLHALRPDL